LQANVLEGKPLSAADVQACWAAAMASVRERAISMADQIANRGGHHPLDELRLIVEAEIRELLGSGGAWKYLSAFWPIYREARHAAARSRRRV
jgi:hypothetical protein